MSESRVERPRVGQRVYVRLHARIGTVMETTDSMVRVRLDHGAAVWVEHHHAEQRDMLGQPWGDDRRECVNCGSTQHDRCVPPSPEFASR